MRTSLFERWLSMCPYCLCLLFVGSTDVCYVFTIIIFVWFLVLVCCVFSMVLTSNWHTRSVGLVSDGCFNQPSQSRSFFRMVSAMFLFVCSFFSGIRTLNDSMTKSCSGEVTNEEWFMKVSNMFRPGEQRRNFSGTLRFHPAKWEISPSINGPSEIAMFGDRRNHGLGHQTMKRLLVDWIFYYLAFIEAKHHQPSSTC